MGKLNRSRREDLTEALRHPLRRDLLDLMLGGVPADPRTLAKATGEPLSRVSYHLAVLSECGVGKARPQGESLEGGVT